MRKVLSESFEIFVAVKGFLIFDWEKLKGKSWRENFWVVENLWLIKVEWKNLWNFDCENFENDTGIWWNDVDEILKEIEEKRRGWKWIVLLFIRH